MIRLCRSVVGALLATSVTITLAAGPAYPEKEIKFIVPWAPGGSNDLVARVLQKIVVDDRFRLIIENVPGATGTIGLTRLAGAKPDGYTIGIGTTSTLTQAAQGLTTLRPEQFTHIARVSIDPLLLLAPANGPENLEAFLAEMKKNDGKTSIGTPGNNNVNHIFASMTARAAGTDYVNAPYPGGSKVITDLVGGHIAAAVLKPSESKAQIDAGYVKPVAVFSENRVPFYPNVPTFKEKGYDIYPYGKVTQMAYIVAPAGLPPDPSVQAFDNW
ncbi:MAG: tripartite tricarboxylate transporter substrate binding protein [Oxalobacteraceae bacterium]|nr:MAG: tripartite tricarboxylate transporter substrate binding protein [Oxalobacteraceae bacterium]